jgi:UDP-N-acetylglucosamine acyltransferase
MEVNRFDTSNIIHPTAIIYDNVEMGINNIIGAYSVIGGNGEIRGKNQNEFKGKVIIGSNNVISELVTIQRPFEEAETKIGDNNIIMAHSHIGHDIVIGNNCEVCTGTIIGGYAVIEDGVKLKLGVTVRNRKKIGKATLVGLGSAVVKDIEDNKIVYGNPAKEK